MDSTYSCLTFLFAVSARIACRLQGSCPLPSDHSVERQGLRTRLTTTEPHSPRALDVERWMLDVHPLPSVRYRSCSGGFLRRWTFPDAPDTCSRPHRLSRVSGWSGRRSGFDIGYSRFSALCLPRRSRLAKAGPLPSVLWRLAVPFCQF